MAVFEVGSDIFGIDLWEDQTPFRSASYVVFDNEGPVLIDTGAARSHEQLLEGLSQLGITPREIRHVIITHVHLDHAGGAGQFMALAPGAILHGHPRAVPHMVDPSRLEQGARAVYGDRLDSIYGRLQPVPSHQVVACEDGSTVPLAHRTLTFLQTPGHAKHHITIWDDRTQGIFSGDMVGIRYDPRFTGWDFAYGFPTTSPSDFNPDAMIASLERIAQYHPRAIYHTHFGVTEPGTEALDFCFRGIGALTKMMENIEPTDELSEVENKLRDVILKDLKSLGHLKTVADLKPLALDIELNSQGILVYLQKRLAGKV